MAEYKNIIHNTVVISGESEIAMLASELKAAKEQINKLTVALQQTEAELGRVRSEYLNLAHSIGIDIL